MATEKPKTTLKAALLGDAEKKGLSELRSDVKDLFNTGSGHELANAVVERIQRYALEIIVDIYGEDEDVDFDEFSELDSYYLDKIRDIVRDEMGWYISSFISDTHREYFVRAHAQGISTSDAVTELMWSDDTMHRLTHKDAMGMQGLRDAQQLVGVLEKLALALKAPEQKTDGNGANALPAPNGNDGDNAD